MIDDQTKHLTDLINSSVIEFRKNRIQYCYFFLGLVAASIAFVVSITKDMNYSYSLIPLGLATASWLYSFIAGMNQLSNMEFLMDVNRQFLENLRAGRSSEELIKKMNIHQDNVPRFHKGQMISYVIGIIFFVLWHLLRMYLNK